MRKRVFYLIIILIASYYMGGCNKTHMLQFDKVTERECSLPKKIIKEHNFDILNEVEVEGIQVILCNEIEFVRVRLKIDGQLFDVGELLDYNESFPPVIDTTKVFGKELIRIHGILGASSEFYGYIYIEDNKPEYYLNVKGSVQEIDLDNDGIKEIVSTIGKLPKTKIYRIEKNRIFVTDVNKSINAKSTYLLDKNKKIFEVKFESGKLKYYYFKDNSLIPYE